MKNVGKISFSLGLDLRGQKLEDQPWSASAQHNLGETGGGGGRGGLKGYDGRCNEKLPAALEGSAQFQLREYTIGNRP